MSENLKKVWRALIVIDESICNFEGKIVVNIIFTLVFCLKEKKLAAAIRKYYGTVSNQRKV